MKKEFEPYINAILETKAIEPILIDLEAKNIYADALIICSASSTRQVQSIGDHIFKKFKKDKNFLSIEGTKEGGWTLIDFGFLVIHIFHSSLREFYDLENLWQDAKKINL